MKTLLTALLIVFAVQVARGKETVLQDFELNNGTEKFDVYAWDYGKGKPEITTEKPFKGKRSLKTAGDKVGINFSRREVNLAAAKTLFLYVWDPTGDNTIEFEIRDMEGNTAKAWSKDQSKKNKWTRVAIDLRQFRDQINLSRVKNLEIYEWNPGTYYYDQVGFDR